MKISFLKALKVLNLIEKKKVINITFFMFIVILGISIVETTVIGSIYPVIEYLYDQESLIRYQKKFSELTNIEIEYKNFPVYFFLTISSLFLISSILQTAALYLTMKIKEEIAFNLKKKALKQYFLKKMSFYDKSEIGDLIQRLLLHTTYCGEIVFFLVSAIKELFIIILIYIFLLFLSVEYTIVLTFVFLVISTFTHRFGKKVIISKTNERNKSQEKLFSTTNVILSAMKVIRIHGKKNYFVNLYLKQCVDFKNSEVFLQTITQLPAIIIKLISFTTIIILVYYITSKSNLEPAFYAVYFAAAYKINNSFGSFSNALLAVNQVFPSFDIMKSEISHNILEKNNPKKLIPIYNFEKKIIFNKILFNHDNIKKPTLEIKNLKINKGDIIGLIGESGSGKSTLLDILTGLKVPKYTKVSIDSMKIIKGEQINFINFAYCNQKQYIFPGSIKQNITIFDENKNEEKLNEIMNICMLKKLFKSKSLSLKSKLYEKGNNLSGGQIQRIGLARTLYVESEIIFLDEALSSVESSMEKQILSNIFKYVKKHNKTLIVVSHNLNFLKKVDRIINIRNGKNLNKKLN